MKNLELTNAHREIEINLNCTDSKTVEFLQLASIILHLYDKLHE